ncbi:alpha/beta fold hydrolase [Spirosoma lituiforme]
MTIAHLFNKLRQFALVLSGCLWVSSCLGQAIKKHLIPVADSKIYVEESGQGPALLLLHAGLLDHRMWQQQVSQLNQRFRVLNCDMRKHGLTQDGDSTFLNSTGLALVLDSLKVSTAHVMGLSLGAVAAVDLVLAHPHRIDKLILAAPGLIGYDLNHDSVLVANQRKENAAKQRGDTLAYVDYFLRSWADGPHRSPTRVNPHVRAQMKRMVSDNLKHHQWATGFWFKDDPLPIDQLGFIRSETLVLVGDQDMSDILAISDVLTHKIPRVKKVVIPGAAHILNLEKPVLFTRIVKSFLEN